VAAFVNQLVLYAAAVFGSCIAYIGNWGSVKSIDIFPLSRDTGLSSKLF
jgi:hypothetical protein